MSTPTLDDDEIDLDDPDATPTPEETARGLRKAANDGRAARAEANRLAREVAFLKAGIDTDAPLGKMFAAGYDGELTKDAVTAAFTALGVVPAAPVETPPVEPDAPLETGEAASTGERQLVANGATGGSGTQESNARQKSIDDANSARSRGGTDEDAIATMFTSRLNAAAAGDKGVLVLE